MEDIIEFLRESNNIEGVFDDLSLQQAIFAWAYLADQKSLTPGVILKTHKILMLHHLVGDQKGYFRKCQVMVGGQEKMRWEVVPLAVDEFCDRIKFIADVKYKKHDLDIMARSLHIQFENIHPFVDGNGRVGRILFNWWRLKRGLSAIVIKNSEKQEYYKWFK